MSSRWVQASRFATRPLVVGQRAEVVTTFTSKRTGKVTREARSSGIYRGVRESNWPGVKALVHYFEDGEINGGPQACFAAQTGYFVESSDGARYRPIRIESSGVMRAGWYVRDTSIDQVTVVLGGTHATEADALTAATIANTDTR